MTEPNRPGGRLGPFSGPALPGEWVPSLPGPSVLEVVQTTVGRVAGDYRFGLPSDRPPDRRAMLVLLTYAYLHGQCHSVEVVRRLESDPALEGLWPVLAIAPEQVRRFRRDHRAALLECLALSLAALGPRYDSPSLAYPAPPLPRPLALIHNRLNAAYWEPFYLQARDCLDRAMRLDSMALDD